MSAPAFDLLIRDATLVGAGGVQRGDLGIREGIIAAIGRIWKARRSACWRGVLILSSPAISTHMCI